VVENGEGDVQVIVRMVLRLLESPWRRMRETVSTVSVLGGQVMLNGSSTGMVSGRGLMANGFWAEMRVASARMSVGYNILYSVLSFN